MRESPRPVPWYRRLAAPSTCTKGLNILSRSPSPNIDTRWDELHFLGFDFGVVQYVLYERKKVPAALKKVPQIFVLGLVQFSELVIEHRFGEYDDYSRRLETVYTGKLYIHENEIGFSCSCELDIQLRIHRFEDLEVLKLQKR